MPECGHSEKQSSTTLGSSQHMVLFLSETLTVCGGKPAERFITPWSQMLLISWPIK